MIEELYQVRTHKFVTVIDLHTKNMVRLVISTKTFRQMTYHFRLKKKRNGLMLSLKPKEVTIFS